MVTIGMAHKWFRVAAKRYGMVVEGNPSPEKLASRCQDLYSEFLRGRGFNGYPPRGVVMNLLPCNKGQHCIRIDYDPKNNSHVDFMETLERDTRAAVA
jgi:hypothetical protein